MTFSYNQPHPKWTDPQAPTVPPAGHVTPRALRPVREVVGVAASIIASFAALAIVALFVVHNGSGSHLQRQVSTLTQQRQRDARAIASLQRQVATLQNQSSAVGWQVHGMVTTVHNLAPFANAVCVGTFQAPNGHPFNAKTPCQTG